MRNATRYSQLIPVVQAVLDTLEEGIASEEAAATELAGLAQAMQDSGDGMTGVILSTGRSHAIRALALRGKRAALLAEYGLEPD